MTARPEDTYFYGNNSDLPIDPSRPLNFVTWNVHKFSKEQSLMDLHKIGEESDIVLVQEAIFTTFQRDYFSNFFSFMWLGAVSFYSRWIQGATGVLTGSIYEIARGFAVRSLPTEPILKTSKMMVFTYFPIKDRTEELLVVNVHAINFVKLMAFSTQMAQLEAQLALHNGPLILAGDFNTYTSGRRRTLGGIAQRLGLTWLAMDNEYRWLQLDQILVRGLTAESASIMREVISSDHAPLKAKLRFR